MERFLPAPILYRGLCMELEKGLNLRFHLEKCLTFFSDFNNHFSAGFRPWLLVYTFQITDTKIISDNIQYNFGVLGPRMRMKQRWEPDSHC